MLGLPKSTEYNKRIPKQKFYDNLDISPSLKRKFTDQIRFIYWTNKIAPTTVNLAAGKTVTEIEVFHVKLAGQNLDQDILKQIDREIPYHILYLLEFDGQFQAWIGYKEEAGSGHAVFKVNRYYHTEWMAEDQLPLKMEGLDIDAVYENFVRQIGGQILKSQPEESLKQSVERQDQIDSLKKQIEKLHGKIRKEKQFNRQIQMNKELKLLKKELEEITNG